MPSNKNGFSEISDYLGNLSKVDPKKLSLESLEEAANFYLKQLLPNIPKSLLKKKHMRDQIKVVVENDQVKVQFEETAFSGALPKMAQQINVPNILQVVRMNKTKKKLKKL